VLLRAVLWSLPKSGHTPEPLVLSKSAFGHWWTLRSCAGVFVSFNFLRRITFLSDFYGAKRKLSIPFR
jgi:hypothetical protein